MSEDDHKSPGLHVDPDGLAWYIGDDGIREPGTLHMVDLDWYCDRGPCCLSRNHEGKCKR